MKILKQFLVKINRFQMKLSKYVYSTRIAFKCFNNYIYGEYSLSIHRDVHLITILLAII